MVVGARERRERINRGKSATMRSNFYREEESGTGENKEQMEAGRRGAGKTEETMASLPGRLFLEVGRERMSRRRR